MSRVVIAANESGSVTRNLISRRGIDAAAVETGARTDVKGFAIRIAESDVGGSLGQGDFAELLSGAIEISTDFIAEMYRLPSMLTRKPSGRSTLQKTRLFAMVPSAFTSNARM